MAHTSNRDLLSSFHLSPFTHPQSPSPTFGSANHEVTDNCNGRGVHSLLLHGVGISWQRFIVAGISFIEI
jgi:hypothetical protein